MWKNKVIYKLMCKQQDHQQHELIISIVKVYISLLTLFYFFIGNVPKTTPQLLAEKAATLNAYQLFTSKTKHKTNLNQEAKKAETKKSYKEPNV